MDKDGNEVMEYHRRLKGIPAPVITHAAEQYDCSIWELYENMAIAIGKENAVQFDLTCGQKRLSLSFYGGRVQCLQSFQRSLSFGHIPWESAGDGRTVWGIYIDSRKRPRSNEVSTAPNSPSSSTVVLNTPSPRSRQALINDAMSHRSEFITQRQRDRLYSVADLAEVPSTQPDPPSAFTAPEFAEPPPAVLAKFLKACEEDEKKNLPDPNTETNKKAAKKRFSKSKPIEVRDEEVRPIRDDEWTEKVDVSGIQIPFLRSSKPIDYDHYTQKMWERMSALCGKTEMHTSSNLRVHDSVNLALRTIAKQCAEDLKTKNIYVKIAPEVGEKATVQQAFFKFFKDIFYQVWDKIYNGKGGWRRNILHVFERLAVEKSEDGASTDGSGHRPPSPTPDRNNNTIDLTNEDTQFDMDLVTYGSDYQHDLTTKGPCPTRK